MTAEPDQVQALLAEHSEAVAQTAWRLRSVLAEAVPDLDEQVRPGWHALTYHHPDAGYVCGVFPRSESVRLVLERGADLPDPHGLLVGGGRQVRALEFRDAADVDLAVVTEYVDLAVDVALGTAGRRRRERGRS